MRSGIATLTVNDRFVWSQPATASTEGTIGIGGGEGMKYRAIRLRRLVPEDLP